MAGLIAMNTVQRPMITDILTLAQLLSPSFPVGAFAYSHGLETAVNDRLIYDATTLQGWLLDLLDFGGAQSDATFLNAAYNSDDPDIDTTARSFAASAERLMEIDLQGAAFCDTVSAIWGHEIGQLCYPVAVGRTAKILNLDPELTTAMYLQAFIGNLTTAAMRLLPLGQVAGQKIQTMLKPRIAEIAAKSIGGTLEDLHSSAWMSDITAMRHETQYSRVFRS